MRILQLGLDLHIRFVSITYGLFQYELTFKGPLKLHISNYVHVGIAFKVAISLQVLP
jgi:hypothetical protein